MSTWGDKLRKISAATLNTLTEAEFSKGRVYNACAERARLGYTWAELRPSIPVNIQECDSVKALVEDLAKEKIRIEWVPIQDSPEIRYVALRVSWEKRS